MPPEQVWLPESALLHTAGLRVEAAGLRRASPMTISQLLEGQGTSLHNSISIRPLLSPSTALLTPHRFPPDRHPPHPTLPTV